MNLIVELTLKSLVLFSCVRIEFARLRKLGKLSKRFREKNFHCYIPTTGGKPSNSRISSTESSEKKKEDFLNLIFTLFVNY